MHNAVARIFSRHKLVAACLAFAFVGASCSPEIELVTGPPDLAAVQTAADGPPQAAEPTRTVRTDTPTTVAAASPIAAAAPDSAGTATITDSDSTATDSTETDTDSDSTEGEAADHPLYVSISVHVEGWRTEATNAEMFEIHRDAVLDVARTASEHDAILSFEIGSIFVDAVIAHDDHVLGELLSLGHSVQVHADVGGAGTMRISEFADQLRNQREALERLVDQPVTHVSGICSQGPWVEAAIRAGFSSSNGAVAYCMKSLFAENVPAGAEWIADCATPSDCHGPMTVTDDQLRYPFLVDSSEDFLSDDGAAVGEAPLVLLVSESSWSINCLDEGFDATRCAGSGDDVAIVSSTLQTYLNGHDRTKVSLLHWSWSIGNTPDASFPDELFEAFNAATASGVAEWRSVADVGQLVGD